MWRPSPGSVGVDPGVRYLPAWAGSAVVQAVDSVGITVSDMDRSVRFFADVLGFEP
ncbi:MAG: glyoxalase, partial [Deltaproteobacteria bacterium]